MWVNVADLCRLGCWRENKDQLGQCLGKVEIEQVVHTKENQQGSISDASRVECLSLIVPSPLWSSVWVTCGHGGIFPFSAVLLTSLHDFTLYPLLCPLFLSLSSLTSCPILHFIHIWLFSPYFFPIHTLTRMQYFMDGWFSLSSFLVKSRLRLRQKMDWVIQPNWCDIAHPDRGEWW